MTPSQEMAEKIRLHLLNGGAVRFATCYKAMILTKKHTELVIGSSLPTDRGVYVRSGKSKTFWMAEYIRLSK